MTKSFQTGATFITTGTVTGASVSAAVGGMGLAGGFGAVGVGTIPVAGAGAVVGAAAYGAFVAIATGDAKAYTAIATGAVSGVGVSSVVGGMGLVAPKIGLAFGIGTAPMTVAGAVVGLAAYGVAKLLDDGTRESPAEVFSRMEAKVLAMEEKGYYTQALLELQLASLERSLGCDAISQQFAALEMEDELQALKAEVHKQLESQSNSASTNPSKSTTTHPEAEVTYLTTQPRESWRCIHTLTGHSAKVNAIAIGPDGKTFATGSDDKIVNLWNLNTGKWLYSFVGQAQAVLSVAISPDGKTLSSGCVDRKITSWSLDTKAFQHTCGYLNSCYSHNSFVNSVAFSPDGQTLASASTDKTIRLWRRDTGKINRTLNGHTDAVLSVAFSPNGKIIASGSSDRTIRLWNVTTYEPPDILTGHAGAVNAIAIAADGNTLISGSTDCTIKVWNISTQKLLYTLTIGSSAVVSLAISPSGEILATSSTDGIIQLWHLHTREMLQTLSGYPPVAFSLDGKTLISGGQNATIKIWHQRSYIQEPTPDTVLSREWWEVLDVDKQAHPQDVKRAYLKLARKYHPDINTCSSAKATMQIINHAYKQFRQKLNFQSPII